MSESEALESVAEKGERLHGLHLGTLKALQDLRQPYLLATSRYAEHVNVSPIQISVDNLATPFRLRAERRDAVAGLYHLGEDPS